jgi:PhnB protein
VAGSSHFYKAQSKSIAILGLQEPSRKSYLKSSINLSFNGDCAEVLRFYEQTLSGKILFQLTWGESLLPNTAPPHWSTKICHSTLVVGDTTFHGVDVLPGAYEPPRGFSVVLDIDDFDESGRLFQALAEKGHVRLPLQETFLGTAIRHGCRSVWHRLGNKLRTGCCRELSPAAQGKDDRDRAQVPSAAEAQARMDAWNLPQHNCARCVSGKQQRLPARGL